MPWDVTYLDASDIVQVTYTGQVVGSDLHDAATRRIALQKESGTNRVLVDASQIETTATNYDVFDLPDKTYLEQDAPKDSRMALVLPTSEFERKLAHFFRNAAMKRGWSVHAFPDHQSAVNWLTGVTNPDAPEPNP